jgi:hypothetical protein
MKQEGLSYFTNLLLIFKRMCGVNVVINLKFKTDEGYSYFQQERNPPSVPELGGRYHSGP